MVFFVFWVFFLASVSSAVGWAADGTACALQCSSASPLHPFLSTNRPMRNRSRPSADFSKTYKSRPNIFPLISIAEDKPSGQ